MLDERTRNCPKTSVIIQGLARKALAMLPDACIDLALCDPPYGMSKADWDLKPDFGDWVHEVVRVLKPSGTAYVFGIPEAVAAHWSMFPAPKRLLTWHVTNRVTPTCKTWQPTQESLVMLWKERPFFDRDAVREPYGEAAERLRGKPRASTPSRFGKRATRYPDAPGALPRDVLRGPGLSGKVGARESLGHPCQKPIWLMEKLVKASSPPGGIVLDLFAGVATASLAAHRLGRAWIAVEKDPRWCAVSLERLAEAGAQAVLEAAPTDDLSTWKHVMEEQLRCLKETVEVLSRRLDSTAGTP